MEGPTPGLHGDFGSLIAMMALFFVSMKEVVWTFLAIVVDLCHGRSIAGAPFQGQDRSRGAVSPRGHTHAPFRFALLIGVDPSSDGAWENLLATIAYYSVSFLTILSLCVGTSIRLNWALLNWGVVSLALTLCAIAVIIQFISDQYLGTTYLNNDNQVAMVQLTWAFFGCIGIGLGGQTVR